MGLTPEQKATVDMYDRALQRLTVEDRRYEHNWTRWKKWEPRQQWGYILYIEAEAEDPNGIEFARKLVSKAVALKLIS